MQIEGKYKWNELRRELKPRAKKTGVFSLRLGDVRENFFINYKTPTGSKHSLQTCYLLHPVSDGDEAVIFVFESQAYAFRMPYDDKAEITVKKLVKKSDG